MPLIIRFTGHYSHSCCSYPEGNFGRNQLLDGSMSLSPLHPDATNDLHVSTATDFQRSFPRLHPPREKITIFRVPVLLLCLIHISDRSVMGTPAPATEATSSESNLFQSVLGVSITLRLAVTLDSLVRVTRRVAVNHSKQIFAWCLNQQSLTRILQIGTAPRGPTLPFSMTSAPTRKGPSVGFDSAGHL